MRHAISFGRSGEKSHARLRGVDRVATALPRAICDRRRRSSFGGTRQYLCHGVRRVDVDVDRAARTALANSRASLRYGASPGKPANRAIVARLGSSMRLS